MLPWRDGLYRNTDMEAFTWLNGKGRGLSRSAVLGESTEQNPEGQTEPEEVPRAMSQEEYEKL